MTQKPDYNRVKAEVSKILFQFNINDAPTPLGTICEAFGINIFTEDLSQFDGALAGFLMFETSDNEDTPKVKIIVSQDDHRNRQRFTIAHELGHYVLHREELHNQPEKYAIVPSIPGSWQSDPLEKEANFFASSLLVPDFLLSEYINTYGKDIELLSNMFKVSASVINYRLVNAY